MLRKTFQMNTKLLSSPSLFVATLLLFAGGLLAPLSGWAQSYPSLSTTAQLEGATAGDAAVIIAIEDYTFLPNVSGAISNGNDWEQFFRNSLGIDNVRYLSNSQATRERILRFADTAAEDVEAGGTLWFIFIGHGAPWYDEDDPRQTDGALVGVDTQQDPESMNARGVRQQEVLDRLNTGAQARTVMIVDACYSGRDAGGDSLTPTMPVSSVSLNPSFAIESVVLTAAEAREVAGYLPGEDRPAFSYLLLGALRGWAAEGGEVRASDALHFTQRALRGVPGRFQQTPTLMGNSDLVLVRNTVEADPDIARIIRGNAEPNPGSGIADPQECEDGRVQSADTAGNCCWPGQVWNPDRDRCVGIPIDCAGSRVVDAESESCVMPGCRAGQVRLESSGACCWQGQVWSTERQVCVGRPQSCPANHSVDGETCRPDEPEQEVWSSIFDDVDLRPGFLPDPHVVTGTSGGTNDASELGTTDHGPCRGMIASNPDHILTVGRDFSYLRIRAYSQGDTSLVIYDMERDRMLCNDDAVGLDPQIEGRIQAGQYAIFVGSYGGGYHDYRLEFSEFRDTPDPRPDPTPTPAPVAEFNQIDLRPGFLPDPHVVTGVSGGSVNANELGTTPHGPCAGMIEPDSPNFIFNAERDFSYLRIRGYSSGDTSLVIYDAERDTFLCNDDTVGLDPQIDGPIQAGSYVIYVGSWGGGHHDFRLEFSEFRETTTPRPDPTPTPTPNANFDDVNLRPGFLPDPHVVTGIAGGTDDASRYGRTDHGPCRGAISTHPDHVLTVERGFSYLRIRAFSDGDTSLVIRGPNGLLYCNDDAVGLDPQIEANFPAGTYEIYVGDYNNAYSDYRLEFSEFRP